MYSNVIIYQLKTSNGHFGKIKAYVPKDYEDFIRCCGINSNSSDIEVWDVFNAETIEDIKDRMLKYLFVEDEYSQGNRNIYVKINDLDDEIYLVN